MMTYADVLFENELGHNIAFSLGSCRRADRPGKSILLEISGEEARTVLVLSPMELDELLKLGTTYQRKFVKDNK